MGDVYRAGMASLPRAAPMPGGSASKEAVDSDSSETASNSSASNSASSSSSSSSTLSTEGLLRESECKLHACLADMEALVQQRAAAIPLLERGVRSYAEKLFRLHVGLGCLTLVAEVLSVQLETSVGARLSLCIVCAVALLQALNLQAGEDGAEAVLRVLEERQRQRRKQQPQEQQGEKQQRRQRGLASAAGGVGGEAGVASAGLERGRLVSSWVAGSVASMGSTVGSKVNLVGKATVGTLNKTLGGSSRALLRRRPSRTVPHTAVAVDSTASGGCSADDKGFLGLSDDRERIGVPMASKVAANGVYGATAATAASSAEASATASESGPAVENARSSGSAGGEAAGGEAAGGEAAGGEAAGSVHASSVHASSVHASSVHASSVHASSVDGDTIGTAKELASVLALRERLRDLAPELSSRSLDLGDQSMVRYVRARKHNLGQAEELFRSAHAWRLRERPAEVHARMAASMQRGDWPELYAYVTGGWCGFDRSGSPLWVDRVGQLDVHGLLARAKPAHFMDLMLYRQEENLRLMAASERRTGRAQFQMCVVQDLKGLSFRHASREGFKFVKLSASVNDDFYPEQLKVCFVVNAPRVFSGIWGMVSRFFDAQTRAKIQIFSGCPTDLLLEHVDRETLPQFLGGDNTVDGDPFCRPMLPAGGKVPASCPPLA